MRASTWFFWTQNKRALRGLLKRLSANGKIFYVDGKAWRWKGVTAFGLMDRFAKAENIDDFLNAFEGFNLLRVFYYVDWPGTGWGIPSDDAVHRFLDYVAARGFYVELVLLTGPKPQAEAQAIVTHCFNEFGRHENLLIEEVNEPGVHDKVDPATLTEPVTPVIWTDGLTTGSHDGLYLTPHTPRDGEWERKGHDLLEYWTGGGPSAPTDPAIKEPAVGDEPAKKEDVGADVRAWRAYFGVCSLLGAGATFHFENGKYGLPPDAMDRRLAAAALEGLNAFPEAAPLGPYSRPEDSSLRTYVVGNYMVRVRPTSLEGVVPGTMLDADGILWKL